MIWNRIGPCAEKTTPELVPLAVYADGGAPAGDASLADTSRGDPGGIDGTGPGSLHSTQGWGLCDDVVFHSARVVAPLPADSRRISSTPLPGSTHISTNRLFAAPLVIMHARGDPVYDINNNGGATKGTKTPGTIRGERR